MRKHKKIVRMCSWLEKQTYSTSWPSTIQDSFAWRESFVSISWSRDWQ